MSTELVMLSNHLILCHPLLLLPSMFPSIRVFPSELALCMKWPNQSELQLQYQSPFNEYSALISFRIGRLDLVAVQGTLKSLLSSVQSLSHVRLFAAPWTAAHQASVSITNPQSLLKLMSIVGDAIQPSHPLLSPSPSALNLPQHQGLFL